MVEQRSLLYRILSPYCFAFDGPEQILSVDSITLYQWLISISEPDYQSFAKGRRSTGSYTRDGTENMINVESLKVIRWYSTIIPSSKKKKDKVTLLSNSSEVYLFHSIKTHIKVK